MTTSSSPHKSNGGNVNAVLPPKPYTEYTIFFRLERTYNLQSSGIIDEEVLSSLDPNHDDPIEFPRPPKYEHLSLPPYWYSSSHKAAIEKKRKHRKRAGRMDLKTLSKTISASWRKADPIVVEYCRKLAKAELAKYKKAIEGIMHGQFERALSVEKNQDQQTLEASQSQVSSQVPMRNGDLFLEDLTFTQAKQSDPAVMPRSLVIPVSTVAGAPVSANFNGLIQAKQADAGMLVACSKKIHKTIPVDSAPVNANFNSLILRESFNGIMGYNDPQIEGRVKSALQTIQHQVAQQQLQAAQINRKLQLAQCNSSPNSLTSSPPPFGNGNASVRPEDMPEEKKNRQKFIRRQVSAPPDFMGRDVAQPYMRAKGDGSTVKCSGVGDSDAACNDSTFPGNGKRKPENELGALGEILSGQDRKELKRMRRATVSPGDGNSKLGNFFQKQLEGGMFTWVPRWEKEDADKLLGLLKVL